VGDGAGEDRQAGAGGGVTAGKKAGKKKKRKPTPGTTIVKDRFIGFPLGRETQMLAEFLRGRGAVPKLVPDLRDDAARTEWVNVRQRATTVPMWYLDWAAVILEQIQERSLRKAGRSKRDAVKSVEAWAALGMPIAEAARMRATLEARRSMQPRDGETEKEFRKRENLAIEDLSKSLARQANRRRKPDA
jgi:hypothetical protein